MHRRDTEPHSDVSKVFIPFLTPSGPHRRWPAHELSRIKLGLFPSFEYLLIHCWVSRAGELGISRHLC